MRDAVRNTRTLAALAAVLALVLGAFWAQQSPARAVSATTSGTTSTAVNVDGGSAARIFDGIGAISGGGGNSRLLIDYPEPQRSQILDYLFKPGYGAALQILKVEIGGDTNSTDGSESSYQHTQGSVNCDTGYEWWLMEQAKLRNPHIKLYGLAWGAPGWTSEGKGDDFFTTTGVNYLMGWLGCARHHGLNIDYLGGWNERGYDKSFYEQLHSALPAHGFTHTQVVGADSGWDVATAMQADPAFKNSIDIVGTHYPCNYMSAMTSCSTTPDALATGKQLWASENGSEDLNTGGAPMARAINRGYLDAKMSAYINWPLIAAIYPNLPYNTMGLMTATQPWSGNYTVGKSLWSAAQTTQFTEPGWQYLDSGSGYLGGDRANGSYVSYRSPDRRNWSTVLETLDATAAQTATFKVSGGLPGGRLHVWASDFGSNSQSDYMVRQPDLTAGSDGTYTLTLQPDHVYTVTTETGGGAGTAASPARGTMKLPYADSFAEVPVGRQARLLSDQQGAFESVKCDGGRSGDCLRQMDTQLPVTWDGASDPYSTLGDLGWTDYTVSVDTRLTQTSGAVQLLGRVGEQQGFSPAGIDAYYLQLAHDGSWSVLKNTTSHTVTTLASGTDAAAAGDGWHRLSLAFAGDAITASIDGAKVASVTDSSYESGQVGIGTSGYVQGEFSRLSITPGAGQPAWSGTYKLVNRNSGKVLDVANQNTADGSPVDQWTDNSGANQQWQVTAVGDGYYRLVGVQSGKPLEVPSANPNEGTQLDVSTGSGPAAEWRIVPSGSGYATLENRATGMMVDVNGQSTSDGAKVIEWPQNGGANQQWQLVSTG
ncbi:RICIN domain-containing protein [Phaeacidiphilus oryzae]|uniref:RICIN domain-containing protein n=1 Tax=Phaeacidiphilus oryzae TaxID=348818 RepID=UPI00068D0142|nr:RICIN domain-containing protein [Phaeacidiphilus oryzae]